MLDPDDIHKGVKLQMRDGERADWRDRATQINFICDKENEGQLKFLEESGGFEDPLFYYFEWRTKYACPGVEGRAGRNSPIPGLGIGGLLLIM